MTSPAPVSTSCSYLICHFGLPACLPYLLPPRSLQSLWRTCSPRPSTGCLLESWGCQSYNITLPSATASARASTRTVTLPSAWFLFAHCNACPPPSPFACQALYQVPLSQAVNVCLMNEHMSECMSGYLSIHREGISFRMAGCKCLQTLLRLRGVLCTVKHGC